MVFSKPVSRTELIWNLATEKIKHAQHAHKDQYDLHAKYPQLLMGDRVTVNMRCKAQPKKAITQENAYGKCYSRVTKKTRTGD